MKIWTATSDPVTRSNEADSMSTRSRCVDVGDDASSVCQAMSASSGPVVVWVLYLELALMDGGSGGFA
eukprot:scaffold109716_cov60-Phaeocystis_antarctica.AAC.2